MYPAEQLRCSLGGNLSRPSLRWRGGRFACSRPVRPGSDPAPDRCQLGIRWTAVGHQFRRAGVTMRRGVAELLSGPQTFDSARWLREQ
jgi:hypothetical protein